MTDNILPFYNSTNKIITHSYGCYVYDSAGKKYIDFESGVWSANLGHSHDGITQAIKSQIETAIHHGYRFGNESAILLSARLLAITGLEKGSSVFLSSGSEAINLSVTLARQLTGRKKILKISNTYLSAYGYGRISMDNTELENVIYNNSASIEAINYHEIAAIVIETGGASIDVVKFPDAPFIIQLIKQATENDCIVIVDEVTTGLGRTGKWFGFQHYNFLPDIVVTGKGLGNGYPVSGITVNEKIADMFYHSPFRYAQSHQNDPLGCRIALEVIKVIEESGLLLYTFETGAWFLKQLECLQEKHSDKIKEARGRGLMLGLQFYDSCAGEKIGNILFEKGFIVGAKADTLRFMPPLIISKENIKPLIDTIDFLLEDKMFC